MNRQRKIAALSAQLRGLRETRRIVCGLIQEIERAAQSGHVPPALKSVVHGLELEGAGFLRRIASGENAGSLGRGADSESRQPGIRASFSVDKRFHE